MAGPFDRAAILEGFLKELQAYLPEIETNLDRLQRQPQNPDALEEIYRRAHTIAGSAAMMDLKSMSQIATGMETILGDAIDGIMPLTEPVLAALRRSTARLRQLVELARTNSDDSAILAQDKADYAAVRGQGSAVSSPAPLPRGMGGPGMPSPGVPMPPGSPQYAPPSQSQPFAPPYMVPSQPLPPQGWGDPRGMMPPGASYGPPQPAHPSDYLPTMPLRDDPSARTPPPQVALTRLAETPAWQDVIADETAVQQCAGALLQSIGALRDLSHQVDGERNELKSFLDGSQDALDRLEQWAGQAMGIDLRTSPDHVRRYLPLSVVWVVTGRMKHLAERLQEATRGLTVQQESLGEEIGHLREAIDRAGQIAGAMIGTANTSPDGSFTASIAQFSYTPPAAGPSESNAGRLRPAERAELERAVREELRRELEDDVRAEIAAAVRRDEERRMRQDLEIQVRRQLLSDLSPSLGGASLSSDVEMIAPSIARPMTSAPHRVEFPERSNEAIDVFRGEADEHLHAIADGITKLEANPGDVEAIKTIRRAVHTLKGAAAITGFTAVADLSHICEDLLDSVADGGIAPTPDVISLILDTSQALEAMVFGDTAEQGGEAGILAALRPRYQVLLGVTLEIGQTTPSKSVSQSGALRSAVRVTEESGHADDEIEPLDAGAAARAAAERADISDLSVRLPLRKLDELVTLFGEILTNRSVVEERLSRLIRMIADGANVNERLSEVGLQLERQYESVFLPSQRSFGQTGSARAVPPRIGGVVSGPNATNPPASDFDPLEMDRYNEFHRLARGLSESISDATTLNGELDALVREMEVALAKEIRLSSAFQDALLKARLVPISSLVARLYRAIRAIAVRYGKEFEFLVEGDDTEMDRSVYEDIAAPLLHLVRNAIYHGIDSPQARQAAGKPPIGKITLAAHYEGNQLVLSASDDGNGINANNIRATAVTRGLIDSYSHLSDRELINLIFQPGFSTSKEVTEEAGRGIGLDVVRDTVTRLRGTIEVDSVVGQGTTFTMKIPINLQIQRVVLVRVGDQTYAIPMTVVEQLVQLDYGSRSQSGGNPVIEVRGISYPLVHLASYLNLVPGPVSEKSPVLLVNSGQQRWGLIVDAVSGRQEIVASSLGPHLRNIPSVLGATVLGNGQVVLILDPVDMLQRPPRSGAPLSFVSAQGMMPPGMPSNGDPRVAVRPNDIMRGSRSGQPAGLPYVLVVDDSPSVRRFVSATLKNVGWDVMTARDGAEALELVAQRTPAAILLDIEMPRMDGYELMAAIRNQPAFQHLPLIVLTSRAATKHQQRALQLGADAYVVKPYQDDQLLRTVSDLVPVNPDGSPKRR